MKKNYSEKTSEKKGRNPKENNNHNRGNLHGTLSRREKRQQEATARDRERSARTNEEQLARLDKGGFTAKRERARLWKTKK